VEGNLPVIAAFGDSLSEGYGADPGKSYPDYLQKLLDEHNYKYTILNAGVSGDTTTDGLERLPGVLTAKPKIVILELGGNDGLRGLPIETTRQNLSQMIHLSQDAGAKVLVAGMTLPRNYGPQYIHQFEQIYIELASQYRLPRIPFLLSGVAGNPNLMQSDGIHPTAEGNRKVADTVFQYLKPLLRVS
jgi:acyl-CoA thioesterase-1